jgi:chemotaxis methyl-accepting protein methylase
VRRARRVDFRGYRRATLHQRLAARMERLGISDSGAYLARIRADEAECDQLIGVLAVTVTSFFRDPVVFEILAQSVLPQIVAKAVRRRTREIRVWCAGCATGEEAYSVAILIHRALRNEPGDWRPLIFATDINDGSLRTAKLGLFAREKLENTKLEVLDKYFAPRGDLYEVHPEIRSMVEFSRDDLTVPDRLCPPDSVFGAFDLVLCRNVIIYFSKELQEAVLDKLSRCLDSGGYLVLGNAEFVAGPTAGRLRVVDGRNRIFRKV